MSEDKTQIHVRVSRSLGDWVRNYARAQNRQIAQVTEELYQRLKDSQEANAAELDEKRVEREFVDVEKSLADLEDEKNKKYFESRQLASALKEAYSDLDDWRLIRVRALTDFNENPDAPWVTEFKITSPVEILNACRIAMDLTRLRESRRILANGLGAKLGIKIKLDKPTEKHEAADNPSEHLEPVQQPTKLNPETQIPKKPVEDEAWTEDDDRDTEDDLTSDSDWSTD